MLSEVQICIHVLYYRSSPWIPKKHSNFITTQRNRTDGSWIWSVSPSRSRHCAPHWGSTRLWDIGRKCDAIEICIVFEFSVTLSPCDALTLAVLNLCFRKYKNIFAFSSTSCQNPSSTKTWTHLFLRYQYHGCWCPGDSCPQGISSHGIDIVIPEYSSLSTTRVNSLAHRMWLYFKRAVFKSILIIIKFLWN